MDTYTSFSRTNVQPKCTCHFVLMNKSVSSGQIQQSFAVLSCASNCHFVLMNKSSSSGQIQQSFAVLSCASTNWVLHVVLTCISLPWLHLALLQMQHMHLSWVLVRKIDKFTISHGLIYVRKHNLSIWSGQISQLIPQCTCTTQLKS